MIMRAQLRQVGRRMRVGAAALLTGLALTGCIQLDQRFEVQNDGSVKADIILALDKEQLALLSSFGEGLTDTTVKGKRATATTKAPDPCTELVADSKKGAGSGATVLPYKSGKFCGARIRQTIPPGGDIKAKINAILESSDDAMGDESDDDEPFFDTLSLKKVGKGWELNGRVGALQEEGDSDDESAALAATFLKDAKIIVRFKLPGKVSTHNATSVEKDGTLVWNIDFLSSKATVIRAKSSG